MADQKADDWEDVDDWQDATPEPATPPPAQQGAPNSPVLRAPERSTWNTLRDVAEATGTVPRGIIPDEGTARGAVASILQGPALNWADEVAGLLRGSDARYLYDPKERDAVNAQIDERTRSYVAGGMDPEAAKGRATGDVLGLGGTRYREGRDAFRNVEGAFRKENPAAAVALTMGSGAALGGPFQGTGSGVARYLPALVEGGIAGAGSTEEANDMGEAAAVGAPLGVAGQAFGEVAGELIGRGIQRGTQALKDSSAEFARRRALAASGYIQKDLKPIMRRNPADALAKGAALLEEGVIPAGGTVSDVADALEPAVEKYGQQIGSILTQADATGAKFDIEPFLQQVDTDILAPIRGDPVVAREVAEIDKLVDGYRTLAQSKGGLTFTEANAMKTRLQNMGINWGNFFNENSPSQNAQQYKVHLQNLFLNSIDDQIGQATSPEIETAFKQAKSQYGTMVDALEKARMGRARMEGNKQFSVTDYMAALGGVTGSMATGDVSPAAAGMGLALANKLARERGASTLAVGARNFSQALPSSVSAGAFGDATGTMSSSATRTFMNQDRARERGDTTSSDLIQGVIANNPEALGPYAAQLKQAAADGNLPLVHYALQQKDPEYRRILDQFRGGTQ